MSTASRRSSASASSSWLGSVLGIVLVALLLAAAIDSSKLKFSQSFTLPSHATSHQTLLASGIDLKSAKEDGRIDDDITRDDACRNYLMNFLNGTTDFKDECTAMNKAYQVADCKDYSQDATMTSSIFSNQHDTLTKNSTENDDKLIDDAFENWECCSNINDYYGKHCRQDQSLDAVKLLGIVSVLVVCGLIKTLIRKLPKLQWVPDAAACIVVGALVGGLLRLIGGHELTNKLAFDNNLFLHILLPPIIFQASLTIDKTAFRRDLFPILTFAVFGTFFSAAAIGYTTHYLSSLPLLDSLLFGALMSSIDPVATLGILSNVGVSHHDTLYTLVFGESLLNDGVSIVLFDSLLRHMGSTTVVDDATVANTLVNFVIVAGGSIFIGCLCGAASTLYFWLLHKMHSAVTEVGLFFAWAFIPYYIADGAGMSGIISIMVMGFVMDYFIVGGHMSEEGEWMEYTELSSHDEHGIHRSSHPVAPLFDRFVATCRKAFSGHGLLLSKSRHHVGFVAEVISSLMETAIFAYLGLFLFNDRVFDVKATFAGLFACVSSRALMVLGLSLLVNAFVWMDAEVLLGRWWRRLCQRSPSARHGLDPLLSPTTRVDDDSDYSETKNYLDVKTQLILFSAGVRGAVSYALVQNIPVFDAVTETGSHYKAELRSMTSCAIVLLMFAFGGLTYFTMKRDVALSLSRHGGATRRLLSSGLSSEPGSPYEESEYDYNSSIEQFEIDGRSPQTNR
ncbi:hypothetical protein MPSEU_000952500 [Mayamaea pseudoterrestris]|nr:hypothetical protein MPSEU_000952500 [Mayamaea pseudoterrestris]